MKVNWWKELFQRLHWQMAYLESTFSHFPVKTVAINVLKAFTWLSMIAQPLKRKTKKGVLHRIELPNIKDRHKMSGRCYVS